jgi:probable phosphoglycerate mutase
VTTRLIAIRHGQSEGNVRRIATSAVDGYPLTEVGREQAAQAGARLADRDVDQVYASPIQRARETAEIVAGSLDAPLRLLPGLEEIDVGVHEGWLERDVLIEGVSNFERWLSRGELDHGFEGGETALQAMTRTSAVLGEVVERHPDGTVVVVSHGGVLAFALINLCWNVTPEFVYGHLLRNCAVVEVEVAGPRWTCVDWDGAVPTGPGIPDALLT